MIYDSDYITEERAVIRLFSKKEKKEIIYDRDFEPYIYAIPSEDVKGELLKLEILRKGKRVTLKEISKIEKSYRGKKLEALKLIFFHPSHVPALRDEIRRFCKIYEYDIPFSKRYLIDRDIKMLDGDTESLKVLSLDIEVLTEMQPDPKLNPIIMISLASKDLKKIFTWKRIDEEYVLDFESEREMLLEFMKFFKELDPEILLTYNGDNFDLPYLDERCRKLGLELDLGEKLEVKTRAFGKSSRIPGISHIDLYRVVRKTLNLSKYSLDNVYREFLSREKSSLSHLKIKEIWEREEDLERLAFYSLEDALATFEIGEHLLPLQYELSRVVGQNLFDVSRNSFSQLVEYLLLREAYKRDEIVPNRHGAFEGTYEGAFVLEPLKGLHENVVQFDFKSLYPSIIISYNVDPTTLGCECCDNKSPLGHNFCKRKGGFIPKILRKLLKERGRIKKLMKSTEDEKKIKTLSYQQWALKILANSFYGYLAYPLSRWYSRECAESVTAWGREYLKGVIKLAKGRGFEVIYGDTDSLFVKMPEKNLEIARDFLKEVNDSLPEDMELEFEGFFERGLFVTKKKYALISKGKITTKGLEVVRRDWAKVAKETQKKVLRAVLCGNPEDAREIIKKVTRRLERGEVDIQDLVINTQITQALKRYKSIPPHVAVARRLLKDGRDIKRGSIISYVVKKGKGLVGERALTVEEFLKEGAIYDSEYYIKNQVMPSVLRIMKAFSLTEDDLRYRKEEQKSLGDWL